MNDKSRSTLFLMELILSILFFSLASAICVQMFVKSHLLSKESKELNHAVIWCESVAEAFYGCEGDMSKLSSVIGENNPDTVSKDNSIYIFYDWDFSPCKESDAGYQVCATLSQEDGLLSLLILCTDIGDSREIYSLNPYYYPVQNGD